MQLSILLLMNMYPDFAFLFKDLFGVNLPGLSILKTFGFFVAVAFFVASYIIYLELKRKEEKGLIKGVVKDIEAIKPLTVKDYIVNAILGFVIGYKVLGMYINCNAISPDPPAYLFSAQGSLMGGILGVIGFLAFKFLLNKKDLSNPQLTRAQKVYVPTYQRVGDIAMIAALFGFLGAKIFNAFESWEYFIQDPVGSLLSGSGLTYYGGLICATVALYYFSKKWGITFKHLCDAAAPALILSYAIGRLGCQVSGDGDWGIMNKAFLTTPQGNVVASLQKNDYHDALSEYADYFVRHKEDLMTSPPIRFAKPSSLSFLPDWFFAYSYPHNINNVGRPIQGYKGDYANVLPVPVFPTPLYEIIMCTFIFLFLWSIRKRFAHPLSIFGTYLVLNGVERFLIEQIRVNYKYNLGFWNPTQAELIALGLILVGLFLLIRNQLKYKTV